MKKTILAVLVLSTLNSFSQKDEFKLVEKALKKQNFELAKNKISLLDDRAESLDYESKIKYYFLRGEAFYENGISLDDNLDTVLESYKTVIKTEKNEKGKYSILSDLKIKTITSELANIANDKYSTEDYKSSSLAFEKAYSISKKDTVYLYNAAASSLNSKDYDAALGYYLSLREVGYTGIAKQEDGTFSKSKSADIIKNIALIYEYKGDNEKALVAIKEARKENPTDISLLTTESNLYIKLDDMDSFKRVALEASELDPSNAELQNNLGIVFSDSGDNEQAIKYFKKAIELNPKHKSAYFSLASVILKDDPAIVEEMNSLPMKMTPKVAAKYDKLKAKREAMYLEAIPYIEKHLEIDPTDKTSIKLLKNLYGSTGQLQKAKNL